MALAATPAMAERSRRSRRHAGARREGCRVHRALLPRKTLAQGLAHGVLQADASGEDRHGRGFHPLHDARAARRAGRARGALSFGKHPAALRCSAHREAARSEAQLLAITSLADAIRAGDQVYRACRVTGALYAALGKASHARDHAAEQTCANRIGSVDPLRNHGAAPTIAQRKAVGGVFDRCVGPAVEARVPRASLQGFPADRMQSRAL